MRPRLDMDAIRRAHPLPDVARQLVPLRRSGGEWLARCPFHADRTPSFTIYDGGTRFKCFGCGVAGDVLDFVQRAYDVSLIEAVRRLDAGHVPTIGLPAQVQNASRINADRQAMAQSIWRRAGPVTGTPAESYLRSRRLHPPYPASLAFLPLRCGDMGRLPCLVAAVRDVGGVVTGVQRIWLAADGGGKADIDKPKRSLGVIRGGAIRLAEPGGDGALAICEGPETGLSLQTMLGLPVWVAAGASFMPAMQFPPAVRSIVIGADNDPAGQRAAKQSAQAFAVRGLAVRIVHPLDGYDDFNAELTGQRP